MQIAVIKALVDTLFVFPVFTYGFWNDFGRGLFLHVYQQMSIDMNTSKDRKKSIATKCI